MKTIFNVFDKRNPKAIWQLSLLLVIGIVIADILTNNIISFEPFLVFPIILTSWYGSKRTGVMLSLLTTIIWLSSKFYFMSDPSIYWPVILDSLTQLASYILLAVIITNFRKVHAHEESAADTDSLTGLFNYRGFYVELADELVRSNRHKHVFSLAYIDIDNFKNINDTFGHGIGDSLLKEVANCLKTSLRKTDTVGRVGGDEFLCLLPETDKNSVQIVFTEVLDLLKETMIIYKWNVSFSVGVISFISPPDDVKKAVKYADELMYHVKNKGKNNIFYKSIE
jgi:diguanylate cyclase (GGDEF)-like protein